MGGPLRCGDPLGQDEWARYWKLAYQHRDGVVALHGFYSRTGKWREIEPGSRWSGDIPVSQLRTPSWDYFWGSGSAPEPNKPHPKRGPKSLQEKIVAADAGLSPAPPKVQYPHIRKAIGGTRGLSDASIRRALSKKNLRNLE